MATHDDSMTASNVTELSETMKARLREIDRDAADAYISTAAFALAVRTCTTHPKPVLVGTEKAILTAADCGALTHHASISEASARRVADAISEVRTSAERLPSSSDPVDPIVRDVQHYRRVRRMMEQETIGDDEATRLHAEAVAPFAGNIPPMVRSAKGAAEVLKMMATFSELDHVDQNCVAAVVAYLEWRA